jgi:hypothetical protein
MLFANQRNSNHGVRRPEIDGPSKDGLYRINSEKEESIGKWLAQTRPARLERRGSDADAHLQYQRSGSRTDSKGGAKRSDLIVPLPFE